MPELLKHEITLSSAAGTGSTFVVSAPAGKHRSEATIAFQAPTLQGTALLVDDDAAITVSTAALLEDWGLRVIVRDSAEAAIATLQTHGPLDALVTDYRLPGRSGIDVVLAARAADPFLVCIVVTGDVTANLSAKVPAGVAVLSKPVSISALATALKPLGLPVAGSS